MTDLLIRAAGTLERLDRSTLVGRYVPWDEPADVVDMTPDGVERYREGFRRGAADRQLHADRQVQQFISFLDGHEQGLGKLGYTQSLRDEADGLYGEIHIHPRALADVDAMIADGITGLSVGFAPVSHREEAGVRWRTSVRLQHVALVPLGAYPSAQVVAWRQTAELADAETRAETERTDRLAEVRAVIEADESRLAALLAKFGRSG